MTPEKKKQKIADILAVVALIGVLIYVVRLWPILLLLLIALIGYAIWALVYVQKQPTVPERSEPILMLPPPASEQSVKETAFGVLQRRVTEAVMASYPDARWVWRDANAFLRFSNGEPLIILLNSAGGNQTASVQVRDLQFVGLTYGHAEPVPPTAEPDQPKAEDEAEDQDKIDYGLLAFEWVEANIQRLNAQSNEVLAAHEDQFRIPAEELPHMDGWPDVCAELVRSGFISAEPVAGGILIKIQSEGE